LRLRTGNKQLTGSTGRKQASRLTVFSAPCSIPNTETSLPEPEGPHRFYLFEQANSCDPEDGMKIFLGILAVLLVAASLVADYKWRQWMAARRRNRR
jgi:hypothetical protein